MKRILSFILAAVVALSAFAAITFAADGVTVYVTVADSNGELVLARENVTATDTDSDGVITIKDALYCAHVKCFPSGADGFATAQTVYGISLTKLWGNDSGSFGYYVNNSSAFSLADAVKAEDSICAFVYTDTATWSDTYSFFNVDTLTVDQYGNADLTLNCLEFDMSSFTYAEKPVAGAEITVNGEATGCVTDADGKVSVPMNKRGSVVISATSESVILVPPVCIAEVARASFGATLNYYFGRFIAALTAFIVQIIGE